MISTPIVRVAINGTIDMSNPKIKEAIISPKSIAQVEIGEHTNLSRVFDLASQGRIVGPTDVAVKKTTMPISPGKSSFGERVRPIVKARKRKSGNINPNIITGPFK
jgi:hypothetical protein